MDPFFIVGVSRSGTSYLHDLLNAHPQVRLSYEGRLFTEGPHCYRHYRNLSSQDTFNRLLDELIGCDQHEPLNDWLGRTIDRNRQALYDRHRQQPSFTGLIEHIYQLPGPAAAWGNKMLRLEMAGEILSLWPQARFLVLVRDPRAVYASQKRFFPHRRLKYSGMYWTLHANAIKNRTLPDEHCLVVRYEDFVADARDGLEQILKFIGVWDPSTADRMLEAHPPRADSIDKWKTALSEMETRLIEEICFTHMQEHGYRPTQAEGPVRLGTLTKITETILDNKSRIPLRPSDWQKKNLLKRFWRTIRS